MGRTLSTFISAIALITVGACGTTESEAPKQGSEFVDLTVSGTLSCDQTRKRQKTAGATQDTYSCVTGSYTGGEWVQELNPTQTGEVVVSVGKYDGYPMVVVLHDTGGGIDNAECVTGNWYTVKFDAIAGEKYYVVVDSDGTVPFVTFDVEAFCAAPAATEQNCSDGLDDDQDWLFDCADPDCDTDAACNAVTCEAYGTLKCGDALLAGSTEGFGTTNTMDTYSCPADRVANSPEHTYRFIATSDGWVTFSLSNFSQYAMLFVLEDDGLGSGCNTNRCIAHNYYSVNFYAEEGKVYYLVADGWGGTTYGYDVTLLCDPPSTESDCGDDIDNDGDGAIDCADTDCDASDVCQTGGMCNAVTTLDCSSTLVHGDTSTSDATNSISSYSCNPDVTLAGPEIAYQIGPFSRNQRMVVTLSNEDAYGMISIVEDAGAECGPNSCVAQNYYSLEFTARRNKTYYAVIEGDFAPSISYDISVVCSPPATEVGADCADQVDNDGDAMIDCDDPDCAADCAQGDICMPTGILDCGTTLQAGTTSGLSATNVIDSYGCYPDASLPGNEYTYSFIAQQTGPVLFTLSNETDYGTIAVLDANGSCDPFDCDAFQFYSVVSDVVAGQTYNVVVDGLNAGTMDYNISVICNPGFTETDCGDNIDNDGDFLVDCADDDCGC